MNQLRFKMEFVENSVVDYIKISDFRNIAGYTSLFSLITDSTEIQNQMRNACMLTTDRSSIRIVNPEHIEYILNKFPEFFI